MRKTFIFFSLIVVVYCSSCSKDHWPPKYTTDVKVNEKHPMRTGLQAIITKYITQGVPGLQVVVKDKNGWYTTGGGYNSIETGTPIKGDSITWIFSITKTYTATLIMKLKEQNRISLDSPIVQYLPAGVGNKIKKSNQITVRMLLNHSSGLVNFIELDEYRARQFADPLNQPTIPEILDMAYAKDLMFEPGSQSYYCNTNYLLLGLLLEHLTGKSYESLLRTEIIQPLGLKHTYYHLTASQVGSLGFSNFYVDLTANGQLQNATQWNNALGMASYYWGGIAARPTDVILFYEALVRGKIINSASLTEMQNFKNDYGLGLESYQYKQGTPLQFGHEGDGIGNSTMVLYIPASNAFIFINCTVGRQLPGPFLKKIIDLKNELCSYVANWKQ